ncbi:MAG TPA: hypothetical protein VF677_05215 [Flavobacterium sp.]|jgi:phage-related protein
MKKTEALLSIVDDLQKIVVIINDLIDMGSDLINQIKDWIRRITTFIKDGFNSIMGSMGGGNEKQDFLEFAEDDLFV